jgi:predicted DNA-binding mobile mystery protein A
MPPKRLSAAHRSLQRRQLDAKLGAGALRHLEPPKRGWIRAIRTALGMTSAQLGKRLGMSAQGAADLERREREGTVTLATLRKAADALECDLVVVLAPRTSLDQTIRDRASVKAAAERGSVMHTMSLEAQQSGVAEAIDPSKDVESWLTTRINRLWD